MRTLVVGANGLLGRHVRSATGGVGPPSPIRWGSTDAATDDLRASAEWMARQGGPWRVAWCAGSGFVGAETAALRAETDVLTRFLTNLAERGPAVRSLFLASSAGAVYAGNPRPIMDELTPVAPISSYGEWKLKQEEVTTQWSRANSVPVLLGRVSNLYGPGQNLDKPQGLLSRIVRSALLRQPLTIFVDLDTRRDYLFAADAGRIIAAGLDGLHDGATVRVIAAGHTTTVSEIAGELHRINRKRVPLVFAQTPQTQLQPRSLAFKSLHPDTVVRTTLPVGLRAVFDDQLAALRHGRLR